MIEVVKKMIVNNKKLYLFLSYLWNWKNRYWQPLKYEALQELLRVYSSVKEDVSFIQVGSNDGVSNDPLHLYIKNYNWAGLCIEPIPDNFFRLTNTYQGYKNIKLLNIAVGKDGVNVLYHINPDKAKELDIPIPEWHNQLASFNRELVVSDIVGNRKDEIVDELYVTFKSFDSIINEFQIERVDLLHIDTEGADWSILSQFPFSLLKPQIIIFEHNHIALSDYKKAVRFLRSKKYNLLKVKTDTLAYLDKDLFKNISHKFYRIFP